jgi:hypothetical protein
MSICLLCGASFEPNKRGRRSRFCKACRTGSSGVCQYCNRDFVRKESGTRFCSASCARSEWNVTHPEHQRAAGLVGGTVRGAQLTRERKNDWYARSGGIFVHRQVAEKILGRVLTTKEVVHHEDKNKRNNDPTNLIVFPNQGIHARHHKLGHCGLSQCDCGGIRLKEVMPNDT